MRLSRNMKLQNKLAITYLLICLIPLIISSFVIYNYSVKSLEETSSEFAAIYNSQIVTNIDNFIRDYDNITKSILVDNDLIIRDRQGENAGMIDRVNRQTAVQKVLMRLHTLKPEIENIALVTDNGSLYQFGRTGSSIREELLREQQWFQKALESEEPLTVTAIHDKSYYDKNKNEIVLTVCRIILDSRGNNVGILLFDIHPQYLLQLNDDFLLARNTYNMRLTVTDKENRILYDSDILSGMTTWEEAYKNGYSSNEDSGNFLLLSNETEQSRLRVITEIPRSRLLFKIDRINYITWMAVLICVSASLAASILFSRTITRPIKKLRVAMKSAEEGQYVTMKLPAYGDEIGSLVRSYNRMISKIRALIEDVYIAEIKQKHARFLALQTQINPHMLYNTLESIRMKAVMSDDDEVADMIKALAGMFRAVLKTEAGENYIADEIEYAENYIKLQNVRYNNCFTLHILLPAEMLKKRIIPMVFQPIVENCILHGYQNFGTELNIYVEGRAEGGGIFLRFSDDGVGMEHSRAEKLNRLLAQAFGEQNRAVLSDDGEGSIGLKNIAERIQLQYGDAAYLAVLPQEPRGTVIEIFFQQENRTEL